jgi:predicted MFS family arabinose efflux permease
MPPIPRETPLPGTPLPRAVRRLAWSNLAAQGAEQMALAAAPIVAVTALGAGVGETGLLALAQTLPFLLLSLPAGLLADRWARRRLMVGAELLRAAALAGLPLLLLAGLLADRAVGLLVLGAAGALAATGTVVFSVTAPALVTDLVARAELARANTLLELVRSLAFASGPALAGSVVAVSGGGAAFALAAGLSVLASLLLAGLPAGMPAAAPRRSLAGEIATGLRFVTDHALLRPIMLTAVGWNTAWFVLQAAFVPFAVHELGLGAGEVGAVMACYGVGMVAGAALAPAAGRRLRFGMVIALGPLSSVVAALCLLASLRVHGAALPGLGFLLFGAGPILWTIGTTTLRQAVTPPAMLGRVSALVMMASAGARPLGAALGGLVGTLAGTQAAIALAALLFAVQAAVILASPVPRLEAVPA